MSSLPSLGLDSFSAPQSLGIFLGLVMLDDAGILDLEQSDSPWLAAAMIVSLKTALLRP